MNTPYIKRYNQDGELTNPILTETLRYKRVVQEIVCKDGSVRQVGHYVLRLNK
jgi:hypothetical protein